MNKTLLNIAFTMSLTAFLFSCNTKNNTDAAIDSAAEVESKQENTADIADVEFVDGMTEKVFHNYLQVKMALTNSDAKGAKTAAGNMAEGFSAERESLKTLAQDIASTDNLEAQRASFSEFTNEIEGLLTSNIEKGTIYKQYCPMAFNNQGGYWFSDVEEIQNPYFGEKMLKCGSVKKTIQ